MILHFYVSKRIVFIRHCIFIFTHPYRLYFRPLENFPYLPSPKVNSCPAPQTDCWICPWTGGPLGWTDLVMNRQQHNENAHLYARARVYDLNIYLYYV